MCNSLLSLNEENGLNLASAVRDQLGLSVPVYAALRSVVRERLAGKGRVTRPFGVICR